MPIKNIPLSSICSAVIHFRNINKCRSLYTISTQLAPITVLLGDNPYSAEPLEYICTDISIKSLKYNTNINRKLKSCINLY